MDGFAHWVSDQPLSVLIQMTPWAIPALQTIHIIAISMAFAAAVIVNLRILGLAACAQPRTELVGRFTRWIWAGTMVLILSGVPLSMAEAPDILPNGVFQIKMALLLAAIGVTLVNARTVRGAKARRGGQADDVAVGATSAAEPVTAGACAGAALALLLWIAIIIAGRWIAYWV